MKPFKVRMELMKGIHCLQIFFSVTFHCAAGSHLERQVNLEPTLTIASAELKEDNQQCAQRPMSDRHLPGCRFKLYHKGCVLGVVVQRIETMKKTITCTEKNQTVQINQLLLMIHHKTVPVRGVKETIPPSSFILHSNVTQSSPWASIVGRGLCCLRSPCQTVHI